MNFVSFKNLNSKSAFGVYSSDLPFSQKSVVSAGKDGALGHQDAGNYNIQGKYKTHSNRVTQIEGLKAQLAKIRWPIDSCSNEIEQDYYQNGEFV